MGILTLPFGLLLKNAWRVGNRLTWSSVVRPMGTVLFWHPIAFPNGSSRLAGNRAGTVAVPDCGRGVAAPVEVPGAVDSVGGAAIPVKPSIRNDGCWSIGMQS